MVDEYELYLKFHPMSNKTYYLIFFFFTLLSASLLSVIISENVFHMETGKQTTLTKKKDDVVVLFPLINFYSLVRSVLLTSLSGATQAEGQLTDVTATDVKAISAGRSQIIFANGIEVRKIICSDDDDGDTTSKGKLYQEI